MKTTALTVLLTLVTVALTAQSTQVTLQSNHTMTISGTSTIHDWESDVTEVSGNATLDLENESFNGINALKLTIPVKGIVSEKGKIMNGKTYDALLAEKHPNIVFVLTEVTGMSGSGPKYKITGKGKLTIAGVTKTVTITADATAYNNSFHIKGSYPMKMSTFGIDPPTAMLGTLKTGDDVTISFDLNFK